MIYQNEYTLIVDIKKKGINQIPVFVKNDTAILNLRFLDNDVDYDISTADRYTVSFKKPSGAKVTGQGRYENGMLVYNLGATEMEEVGMLEVIAQVYIGDTRISTRPFQVKIIEDIENGIASQEQLTLLQELFIEVDNHGQYAKTQGDYAKSQGDNLGHKGNYVSTVAYKDGNVVTYGGVNYICIKDTTAGTDPTNGTYWTSISPQASINEQSWTATEGQTVYTITNGKYVLGKGNIEVWVGGVFQIKGQGYTETSETTFTLTSGVSAGTIVYAKWFEGHMTITKGHMKSHELGGQDELDITKLKNFQEQVVSPLADTEQQLPLFKRKLIESGDSVHAGGFSYSSFCTGATFKGKEIYVVYNAPLHWSQFDLGIGKLVAYTRKDDGSFSPKILNLNYTSRQYRDPNLTVAQNGDLLFLSAVAMENDNTYKTYTNWYWILDANLDVVNTFQIHSSETTLFGFGNMLHTPAGKLIKGAYQTSTDNGVVLLASPAGIYSQIATWTKVEIFPPSSSKPTEVNIAYWGEKLICVCRQDNGNMLYRETFNLDGTSGWGDIKNLGFKGDAPAIEPFIPKGEPLHLTYSIPRPNTTGRVPQIRSAFNAEKWTKEVPLDVISQGGYNSFVRNKFGFGVMYYEDKDVPTYSKTDLWFKDISIPQYQPDLSALKREESAIQVPNQYSDINGVPVLGNPRLADRLLSGGGLGSSAFVRFKNSKSLKSFVTLLSWPGSNQTIRCDVYKDGVLLVTGDNVTVTTNTDAKVYRLTFPATTFEANKTYEFRIVGVANTFVKGGLLSVKGIDMGDFIYEKTTYNSSDIATSILSCGFVVNM